MPVKTFTVSANGDDASESGGVVVTVYGIAGAADPLEFLLWRFLSVDIPRNAIVADARLTVTRISTSGSPAAGNFALDVFGEKVGDSAAPNAATPNGLSSRPRTTASVRWTAVGAGTNVTGSPNLKDVLAEVFAQAAWNSGQDIALIGRGVNAPSTVYMRDTSSTYAAVLSVLYYDPSVTVSPSTGSAAVSGGTPAISVVSPTVVSPSTGSAALSGGTPVLAVVDGADVFTVSPSTGSAAVSGGVPALEVLTPPAPTGKVRMDLWSA